MPDNNRQVGTNAVSSQSAGNIEEAIWRLKIHDNNQEEDNTVRAGPYPDRPGEPDCVYYLRTGVCGYGSNCRYNHPPYPVQGTQFREELPERVGQPDCGYYLKTGTCKYGSTCKYHHPRDRNGAGPVSFNTIGLPMRQDEKSCPHYMRTGSCKFGAACKFHHPQPGTGVSLSGLATFGATGSLVMPSAGLPYVGGLPTWSLPRAPYGSGTRLHGPQAYMPVVLSTSQGIVPVQGWNTYVGNLSPMPSPGILGSNLVYNSRNQGESGSGGQMYLSSTACHNLPEKPDQPECRHFMNTGTCKYGSDCKYHHPKERIAQVVMNPLGLPSRPGQAVCSNYTMYGLCKFGQNCKFDHPLPSYPYNHGLGLQPISIFNSSLLTYPRMPPTATLSETAPPSLSSKFPVWAQNAADGVSNKAQNPDRNSKVSDDPPNPACSPPPDSSSSSEPSRD